MNLTDQLKARRHQLGLQQKDMKLRAGMNQQNYQRIEAGGNPRLETLELIAEGLEAELMLIPKDKVLAVNALLSESEAGGSISEASQTSENPWSDLLV
jgi:predicted transcriptional regulator